MVEVAYKPTTLPKKEILTPFSPKDFKIDFGTLNFSEPTVTGTIGHTFYEGGAKRIEIDAVNVEGNLTEAGGPGEVILTLTLKKNDITIATISKFYSWGVATTGNPEVSLTFPFYQPLVIENHDKLFIVAECSNYLDWDNLNLDGISAKGRAFW